MSNVIAFHARQPAKYPFTDEQRVELAIELDDKISAAFEELDVDTDKETRDFVESLEGWCRRWVIDDLNEVIRHYEETKDYVWITTDDERRLRRLLAKHGYSLRKSRARNRKAPTYGLYWVIDTASKIVVSHGAHADGGMTYSEVEDWQSKA